MLILFDMRYVRIYSAFPNLYYFCLADCGVEFQRRGLGQSAGAASDTVTVSNEITVKMQIIVVYNWIFSFSIQLVVFWLMM